MSKLIWIALCGLTLAGCADHRNTSGSTSASGGSSATTATGGREDMRGSNNTAPGDEGDRQKPAGSTAPRSTY
jgi:hypothetical protein